MYYSSRTGEAGRTDGTRVAHSTRDTKGAMATMQRLGLATAILVLTSLPVISTAAPRRIVVRAMGSDGRAMTVSLTRARAKEIKKTVATLKRARMKGYVSLFKGESVGEGATPVTGAPNARQRRAWLSIVGDTVGFGSTNDPSQKKSASGTVRVGARDFDYWELHKGSGTRRIDAKGSGTEAAIAVDATEFAALNAFYAARTMGAIKDRHGEQIFPAWGGLRGVKKEECTGAATSVLAASWIRAFELNVPALRQRAANVQEFAGLGPEHVSALRRFADRMSASGVAKPTNSAWIAVVRAFGSAKLVTASAVGSFADPMAQLAWDGQWQTQAPPRVIPDLTPGKSSRAYQSARISYADFLAALPTGL